MSDIANTWAEQYASVNGTPVLRDAVPMPDEGSTHPSKLGNLYHKNRTAQGWACKFNEACGRFPSPVHLGRHYADAHPDEGHVPSKLKRTGTTVQQRNGNRGIPEGPRVCTLCEGRIFASKDTTRKHFRRQHAALYRADSLAWVRHSYLVGDEPEPEAPEGSGNGNYACTSCGHRTPTMRGACSHYRRKHGARGVHESQMWRLVEGGVGSVPALVEHDEHDPDTDAEHLPAPLSAADIVTTVADAMAYPSGVMPSQHLRPLLAWYDHTRAFLAAVADTPTGS